jgi:hypothetical protein
VEDHLVTLVIQGPKHAATWPKKIPQDMEFSRGNTWEIQWK